MSRARSKRSLNQRKKRASGPLPSCLSGSPGLRIVAAERRRQDQRDQHRQRHRRDEGQRELAIDDAGRPAEEGHRQEDRREHDRDRDQRAGNLVHRVARRLLGRKAFLLDQPFDILDDDDRVVDQQADRQHHAEQGQGVDAEPGDAHHRQRAEQDDRDGDGRDERRAQFWRNRNITRKTRTIASNRVSTTCFSETLTNGVVSHG